MTKKDGVMSLSILSQCRIPLMVNVWSGAPIRFAEALPDLYHDLTPLLQSCFLSLPFFSQTFCLSNSISGSIFGEHNLQHLLPLPFTCNSASYFASSPLNAGEARNGQSSQRHRNLVIRVWEMEKGKSKLFWHFFIFILVPRCRYHY